MNANIQVNHLCAIYAARGNQRMHFPSVVGQAKKNIIDLINKIKKIRKVAPAFMNVQWRASNVLTF